jgi:hypothetical protein
MLWPLELPFRVTFWILVAFVLMAEEPNTFLTVKYNTCPCFARPCFAPHLCSHYVGWESSKMGVRPVCFR